MKIRLSICVLAAAAVIALDQWIKRWASDNLMGTSGMEMPTGLVRLVYAENKGAAFGMLENMRWLFVVLGVIVVTCICIYVVKERVKSPALLAGLTLIVAGTLGNLWDRAVSGFVVDMFEFTFINFAICNIADFSLTCGGVITCLYIILYKPKAD